MEMSRVGCHSLALDFNLPRLFSSSPPFFFRLCLASQSNSGAKLPSPCNETGQPTLRGPNSLSLQSTTEKNSSSPTGLPSPPTVSPSFRSIQVPSSPSQCSTFSHSLSAFRKKNMQPRHRMRCRRGGGGRGDGGRSSGGSRPPLSARDDEANRPSASNVANFIFNSELNRPRVTTTITVSFQEEASGDVSSGDVGFGARKRKRKSTILDKPPQVSRNVATLPVKTGSHISSSDSSGSHTSSSDDSAREDTAMKSSSSPSSSEFSAHKSKEEADDPDEDYSCPIVEEIPPHNDS